MTWGLPLAKGADEGVRVIDSRQMVCAERKRLAEAYRESVDRFREAVSALDDQKGSVFESFYRYSEPLRETAELDRIALEEHRHKHRL